MAAIQLKPLLETVSRQSAAAREGFDDKSGRRLTYCGIVVVLITMFLAGYMAWNINDGCPTYQKVVHTLVAFTNGWLYILYVVIGSLLDSFKVGCGNQKIDLNKLFSL
jgi:uncharacterized membrane protein